MNLNFLKSIKKPPIEKGLEKPLIERTERERIVRYVVDSAFITIMLIAITWWISLPVEFEMSISLNNELASNVLNSIAPEKFNLTNVTLPDGQNMITVKGKSPFFVLLSLD